MQQLFTTNNTRTSPPSDGETNDGGGGETHTIHDHADRASQGGGGYSITPEPLVYHRSICPKAGVRAFNADPPSESRGESAQKSYAKFLEGLSQPYEQLTRTLRRKLQVLNSLARTLCRWNSQHANEPAATPNEVPLHAQLARVLTEWELASRADAAPLAAFEDELTRDNITKRLEWLESYTAELRACISHREEKLDRSRELHDQCQLAASSNPHCDLSAELKRYQTGEGIEPPDTPPVTKFHP